MNPTPTSLPPAIFPRLNPEFPEKCRPAALGFSGLVPSLWAGALPEAPAAPFMVHFLFKLDPKSEEDFLFSRNLQTLGAVL